MNQQQEAAQQQRPLSCYFNIAIYAVLPLLLQHQQRRAAAPRQHLINEPRLTARPLGKRRGVARIQRRWESNSDAPWSSLLALAALPIPLYLHVPSRPAPRGPRGGTSRAARTWTVAARGGASLLFFLCTAVWPPAVGDRRRAQDSACCTAARAWHAAACTHSADQASCV